MTTKTATTPNDARTSTKRAPIEITVAGDFGYSTAQLYGTMLDISEPSYFLPVDPDTLPDTPEQGFFTYVEGDSAELLGQSYAVGSLAYDIDAKACRKNADSAENKIESSLIMLLGLITYKTGLPTNDLRLNILTCLQKVTPELKGKVINKLRGSHTIRCGKRVITVEVNPIGCADEGLGVLVTSPSVDIAQNIVVVSLGGGTTNVGQFNRGRLISQKAFEGGVMRLYEALTKSQTITSSLNTTGDIHRIREGVERADFFYGRAASPDRFSFEDDYYVALPAWINSTLKRPLQYAKPLLMGADKALVFGGGAMLPGLKSSLQKYGYGVVADPVGSNVKGLYELAKRKVGGK